MLKLLLKLWLKLLLKNVCSLIKHGSLRVGRYILMLFAVNSNANSLATSRALLRASAAADKNVQKLSTGLHMNYTSNDAAGLGLSATSHPRPRTTSSELSVTRSSGEDRYRAINALADDSNIRSADLAYESADLARRQIAMQRGVSALAQANQNPQEALRLLG